MYTAVYTFEGHRWKKEAFGDDEDTLEEAAVDESGPETVDAADVVPADESATRVLRVAEDAADNGGDAATEAEEMASESGRRDASVAEAETSAPRRRSRSLILSPTEVDARALRARAPCRSKVAKEVLTRD